MIKKFLLLMPIIILSLFFVNIAPAFAADDIDMNLTSNETSNTMATASTYQPTTSSTYSTTSSSGLDISNILNFEKDFKGTKIIKLEQNYRCTQNILNAANSVIKNNEVKYKKKLYTLRKNVYLMVKFPQSCVQSRILNF